MKKYIVTWLAALSLLLSGCEFHDVIQHDSAASNSSVSNPTDESNNKETEPGKEFSPIVRHDDVSVDEAGELFGGIVLLYPVDTQHFDSDNNRALFYAANEKVFYELYGVDEGSVNRSGNTINFTMIESDPDGLYHIDINTGELTRTTVFEDILCVPEDESEIIKIPYGGASEGKYIEIYAVYGNLYMRDKFEFDGKDTFYAVQRVNSAINFDMYAVKRMEENPDGKYFLNYQYMLVDPYEKKRVIYKENLDDAMADSSSSLMTIIGASEYGTSRSILIGRQTDGDEYGAVKYTDVRIFHIEDRTAKNRDNNCYYDPLETIVQYRSNMYGVCGTMVEFPSNISLYPTGINNVFEIYFPESSNHSSFSPSNEWAVLHLANNMYFNVSSIPCGTLPPTNIAEFVDENSSIGVKYLRVDFVYMGNDTRKYLNENTREVLTEEELPQDVSLVPVEADEDDRHLSIPSNALSDRHILYEMIGKHFESSRTRIRVRSRPSLEKFYNGLW